MTANIVVSANQSVEISEGAKLDCNQKDVTVDAIEVYINHGIDDVEPTNPPLIHNWTSFVIDGATTVEIYNSDFGDALNWVQNSLDILNSPNYEIVGCNFEYIGTDIAVYIDLTDRNGSSEGIITDCIVDCYNANGATGISVNHFGANQVLDIENCVIKTYGTALEFNNLQNAGILEENSKVRVFGNQIGGGSSANFAETGIDVYDAVQKSLLIRNNVIRDVKIGIKINNNPAESSAPYPLIYNNAIFNIADDGIGIYAYFWDDTDVRDIKTRIRNNVIWQELVGAENTVGIYLFNSNEDASMNDIDVENNIIGNLDIGIYLENEIDDWNATNTAIFNNAFKGNTDNVGGEAWMTDNDNIVHGDNSEWVTLVDEDPTSSSWNFHIFMDCTSSESSGHFHQFAKNWFA